MHQSVPRLMRGSRQLPPSAHLRGHAKGQHDQRPVFSSSVQPEQTTSSKPIRLLEASLFATVDDTDRRSIAPAEVEQRTKTARPSARLIPAGTATHLPNAHTRFSRQDNSLGPRVLKKPSPRQKPAFRKTDQRSAEDLYASYLERYSDGNLGMSSTRPPTSSIKPAFRRSYSSTASPVATSSRVRIEDLDPFTRPGEEQSVYESPKPSTSGLAPERSVPTRSHSEKDSREIHEGNQADFAFGVNDRHRGKLAKVPDAVPRNKGALVNLLLLAKGWRDVHVQLPALYAWHKTHPSQQSTGSYNVLLQMASEASNFAYCNQMFDLDMPAAGIGKDSVTWDILMGTWARRGRWDKVVDLYTARQEVNAPLRRVGWTRIARAATKRGNTTLDRGQVSLTMSPIYRALYDLPRGVRQLQLRKLTQAQKLDVDQLLAMMMPEDLHPMDFPTALVISHRLVKQTRWREAEEVVTLWLDQTRETWEAPPAPFDITSASANDPLTADVQDQNSNRQQESVSLLHVLLEGLVIGRNKSNVLMAYLEEYLSRYERTGVSPTYHTLFFVLSAFRLEPLNSRFRLAREALQSLEQQYNPPLTGLADKYGLSRCLRQMHSLGVHTIRQYTGYANRKEYCEYVEQGLRELEAQLGQLHQDNWHGDLHERQRQQRLSDGTDRGLPSMHRIVKEPYRILVARNRMHEVVNKRAPGLDDVSKHSDVTESA